MREAEDGGESNFLGLQQGNINFLTEPVLINRFRWWINAILNYFNCQISVDVDR